MANNREVMVLIRDLRKQGFEVTQNGHWKVKRDGKTIAVLPLTPGGGGTAVRQMLRREKKKLVAAGWQGEVTW